MPFRSATVVRRGPFFRRVFTRLGIVLSVGMLLVCLFNWQMTRVWLRTSEAAHLTRDAQLAHEIVARNWPYDSPQTLIDECRTVRERTQLRLTIIDPKGNVIADSDADPSTMENHAERPEVRAALDDRIVTDERQSATVGRPFLYVAVPVKHENRIVAVVRAAAPAEYISRQHDALAMWIVVGLAVALPLAMLLAWVIANTLAGPIRRVSEWARRLATGDLTTSVQVSQHDEVGQVAESLELMRSILAARIREAQQRQQDLEITLASLEEGVIAVAADGSVLMANAAASRMLSVKGPMIARPLRDLLGSRPLLSFWEQASASTRPETHEEFALPTFVGDRSVDVGILRIQKPETPIAWLLCMRDVTDAARSASMKADFVANASHELRTPVAAIRAAVETLQGDGMDAATRERFLSVIERHAERLENMTNDLMDLNRVESAVSAMNVSEFDPSDAFAAVIAAHASGIAAKNASVDFDSESVQSVMTDRSLLDLVLKNLVDNALKFIPAKGHVHLRCHAVGDYIRFEVSDNGCGIPAQDLERVFERFYQVDKSRSRSMGGTGLGLAIVKHAVHRMGGVVGIESKVGEGTTVSFTIPVAS